jgi:hypothetical protein
VERSLCFPCALQAPIRDGRLSHYMRIEEQGREAIRGRVRLPHDVTLRHNGDMNKVKAQLCSGPYTLRTQVLVYFCC